MHLLGQHHQSQQCFAKAFLTATVDKAALLKLALLFFFVFQFNFSLKRHEKTLQVLEKTVKKILLQDDNLSGKFKT